MEKLIPVINKLQDVFNTIGADPIDLPQIVVVGSQSSGKSSVLESIVGRDFLPRGSGIVTRRPLVLQLTHLPTEPHPANEDEQPGKEVVEWGEFSHLPNEMFTDFDRIRQEIERETDRLTGTNKGISPIPITLKVYSPHVVNLTLVDLPGIARVPVGDQPADIEQQIRRMVLTYIEKPNAVILAITAANTDLANSDALQLARSVDPAGDRTVGVLTKLDLMDRGTDALDILQGRVVPLKLGYVGVVNRSQQDINTKKRVREALKEEERFFASHPLYKSIAARCGTAYLAKTLNKILVQHIRRCLPDIKSKVNQQLTQVLEEGKKYADAVGPQKSAGATLLQAVARFCDDYRDAIDGKLPEPNMRELFGGARLHYVFQDNFGNFLDRLNPLEGLTFNEIRVALRNATGPRTPLFIPESCFEVLIKNQIRKLHEPAQQCVQLVHDELNTLLAQVEPKELIRYPRLREAMISVSEELLLRYKLPTCDMVRNLITVELAFINTNHPDFVARDGAISAILENLAKSAQDAAPAAQQPSPGRPVSPAVPAPAAPAPPLSSSSLNPQESSAHRHRSGSVGTAPSPNMPPPSSAPNAMSSSTFNDNSGFWGAFFGNAPSGPPSTASSPSGSASSSPAAFLGAAGGSAPQIAASLLRHAKKNRVAARVVSLGSGSDSDSSGSSLPDLAAIATAVAARHAASQASANGPAPSNSAENLAGAPSITGGVSLSDLGNGLAGASSSSLARGSGSSSSQLHNPQTPLGGLSGLSSANIALFGSNSLEQFASLSTLLGGVQQQSVAEPTSLSTFGTTPSLSSLFPAAVTNNVFGDSVTGLPSASFTSLPSLSSFLSLSPHATAANASMTSSSNLSTLQAGMSAQNLASMLQAALAQPSHQPAHTTTTTTTSTTSSSNSDRESMPPPSLPVNTANRASQMQSAAQPQAPAEPARPPSATSSDVMEQLFAQSEGLRKLWMTAMQMKGMALS